MSITFQRLIGFPFLGMLGGFLFLHSYVMLTWAILSFYHNQNQHFDIIELWYSALTAFEPTMMPMTISFVFFGGFGFFLGLLIDRNKRLLDAQLENEKNRMALENIEKLKDASVDTIYRLAKAAEYRDTDTAPIYCV